MTTTQGIIRRMTGGERVDAIERDIAEVVRTNTAARVAAGAPLTLDPSTPFTAPEPPSAGRAGVDRRELARRLRQAENPLAMIGTLFTEALDLDEWLRAAEALDPMLPRNGAGTPEELVFVLHKWAKHLANLTDPPAQDAITRD